VGAVTNPVMPIFRQHELSFMLRLAETRLMVIPESYRGFDYPAMIAGLRPSLPDLRHVLVVGGSGPDSFEAFMADAPAADRLPPFPPADGNAITQLLYTSGTTGEPKGVMHTGNTLIGNVEACIERLGLGSDDVVLMASPLAHQTGFMYGMMMPVMLGATSVLQDVWEPGQGIALIRAEGVSFTMASTPFLTDLTNAVEAGGHDLPSLRVFLVAGAPIPRALVERAGPALGTAIVSAWGMTENGLVTMTRPDDDADKTINTDGFPLRGMEVRVVDADGIPLGPDEEGRLQARTYSNFIGYLKRPEWYGHDDEGWFDTGDLARIDADGYARLTGRSKDIIIRGGENIPVVEIEGLLFRHPDIDDVAIVGMPDERLGERACAFVVVREGASVGLAEVVAWLRGKQVAIQYMPERVEVVAALPRTASGKIQKFRLREMAATAVPAA
jgi:cyclohexanecarboxylate-CoA ligase